MKDLKRRTILYFMYIFSIFIWFTFTEALLLLVFLSSLLSFRINHDEMRYVETCS